MTSDRLTRFAIVTFAGFHLIVGLLLAFAPHFFFRTLGGFDTYNRHYAGDNATFDLALGAGLLVALFRPSWRTPLLAVTALQAVLHALNHLIDIGDAQPRWIGVFDFVSLALLAGVAVWVALLAGRGSPPHSASG